MSRKNIVEWIEDDDADPPSWVRENWDEYIDAIESYYTRTHARHSSNTMANRATAFKQFSRWYYGNNLDDVNSTDVGDYMDYLQMQGYGFRSIRQKVYIISSLYESLIERTKITYNPVGDTEIEKYEKSKQEEEFEQEYVSKDDIQKMVNACNTTREELLLRLFIDCGLRVSEAISVKLADLDRAVGKIEIENSKTQEMESDDTREVFYDFPMKFVLTDWLDNGERNSYFGSTGNYLVCSDESEQMYEGTASDIIRDIADRAGVLEIQYYDQSGNPRYFPHPHALRKSYGVFRTKNGMPLAYLSDLLGHSSVEVTRQEYLEFREDDKREADKKYREQFSS